MENRDVNGPWFAPHLTESPVAQGCHRSGCDTTGAKWGSDPVKHPTSVPSTFIIFRSVINPGEAGSSAIVDAQNGATRGRDLILCDKLACLVDGGEVRKLAF